MSTLNRPADPAARRARPAGRRHGRQSRRIHLEFPIAACDFSPTGGNAFLNLKANRQLYLSNKECDDCVKEWTDSWSSGSRCLPETRVITFPYAGKMRTVRRTRVMEEYETEDGEVEEISKNFFADCNPMNDVYYFGEDVFDGDGNPLPDAWLAGKDGAKPGHPHAGSRIPARFAVLPGIRAECEGSRRHTSMGFEVEVPAGTFQNCVEMTETSPLEPGTNP